MCFQKDFDPIVNPVANTLACNRESQQNIYYSK